MLDVAAVGEQANPERELSAFGEVSNMVEVMGYALQGGKQFEEVIEDLFSCSGCGRESES